jgi:hypothetical protein
LPEPTAANNPSIEVENKVQLVGSRFGLGVAVEKLGENAWPSLASVAPA